MDLKDFRMENLKQIREQKNFTQVKVSVDIGFSQELLSQYEIGKSKPTIDNLIKLADYFHCSTDYLLNRTNNPTPINQIDKNDIEIANLIQQYNSLSSENKKHLHSYLNHLCSTNE